MKTKQTNKQKYYTMYMYDKTNNDIVPINETTNRLTASQKLGVNIKNLNKYCINALELFKNDMITLPEKLKECKYFIVIDTD